PLTTVEGHWEATHAVEAESFLLAHLHADGLGSLGLEPRILGFKLGQPCEQVGGAFVLRVRLRRCHRRYSLAPNELTNAVAKYSQSKGDGQSYPCPSIASAHLDARLDPAFPVPVVEPLVEDVLDQVLDLGWRPSPLRRPILLGEFTACAV